MTIRYVDKSYEQLEANIEDLEKVLFSLSTGNGIPDKYSVQYDYQEFRCKVSKRVRLGIDPACFGNQGMVFTKDEIMEAIKKLWREP